MATQSTKKPDPGAESEEAAPEKPAAPAEIEGSPFVGEYLDETPRTYQFVGAPPQTAEKGDVCELPYDPRDGRWQPSTRKVTRLPDDHPDQMEIASARQSKARNELHARLAEEAKGGEQR